MSNEMKITVWGSRGTFPQTSINKSKYGLQTSCISLETKEEIIIFDCGSGIIDFSNYFYENNLQHKKLKILFTHYHYDHIMGLPFAKFIYDENVKIDFYGKNIERMDVENILKSFFSPPYFPINILARNNITIKEIEIGRELQVGNIKVNTILLNHPGDCVGFKITNKNKDICIIFDYEYRTDKNKQLIFDFINNVDLLFIDSYYTDEDYMLDWGHSTIEDNIKLIIQCNVKQGLLTHHNIKYTDDFMHKMESTLFKDYSNVSFAKDNMVIEL